ncbi:MAG TPA: hypothetical protein V6C76_05135 [Drouetiella sp.]
MRRQLANVKEQVADSTSGSTSLIPADQNPSFNSLSIPDQNPSSNSLPIPDQNPSSNSLPIPNQSPSSNSLPIPNQNPSSNSLPIPNQNPSSNSLPIPNQSPSSNSLPIPNQSPLSNSLPIPDQSSSSSSLSTPGPQSPSISRRYDTNRLRPAEIAYLSSNGDISHTLLVLGADLIQRALKSRFPDGNVPPLAPYEVRMWGLAKETVADWAQGRLEKHLPGDIKKDPIEYVRRVSKIYNFIVHTARHFVTKLIQDPRQIRRYFKLSAVATLIADFSTAGYKAAFEAELRNNLRARGLIVPQSRKQSYARHYTITAVAAIILIAALIFALVQPWPLAAGLIGMCFLSAAILRVILLVLNSIPYISEIAEVIGHIQRQSWRLQALRLAIRVVTALTYTLLFIGFLAMSGIAFAILTFGFHHSHILFLGLYVFLTMSFIVPIQIYVDGWQLKIEEMPTTTGEKLLSNVRQELKDASPLDSFREVLSTTEYVPTFSELLALYGIETLLILV